MLTLIAYSERATIFAYMLEIVLCIYCLCVCVCGHALNLRNYSNREMKSSQKKKIPYESCLSFPGIRMIKQWNWNKVRHMHTWQCFDLITRMCKNGNVLLYIGVHVKSNFIAYVNNMISGKSFIETQLDNFQWKEESHSIIVEFYYIHSIISLKTQ